jgi:inner membrane protein
VSHSLGVEYLGWIATAVFVGSYFCLRAWLLRGVQMVGALLWIAYGVLIGASPVIVANVLVFSAAAWTLWRRARPGSVAEMS